MKDNIFSDKSDSDFVLAVLDFSYKVLPDGEIRFRGRNVKCLSDSLCKLFLLKHQRKLID